jgi:acetate kinase
MQACDIAPLHNPANLQGIDAALAAFPSVPQVAVFDTAFHQTMPPHAYTYPLPTDVCEKYGLRRYGFHGQSYHHLVDRAAAMLGKSPEALTAVMCHLGAGSSMCAVRGGRSIDTTMGFTPLEGLMMATRAGDVDSALVWYLVGKGMSLKEVDALMNKQSGFLGMTGRGDVKTVVEAATAGDARCKLALDVYVWRVRKYLGAYLVHLGGPVDALVFSAGIGERSAEVRRRICEGLDWAGIQMDQGKNAAATGAEEADVSAAGAGTRVLVLPTDEELSIAKQTTKMLGL